MMTSFIELINSSGKKVIVRRDHIFRIRELDGWEGEDKTVIDISFGPVYDCIHMKEEIDIVYQKIILG